VYQKHNHQTSRRPVIPFATTRPIQTQANRPTHTHKKTNTTQTMATQQQEDGYYPRVNASMLQQGCEGQIVSLIGSVAAFDGTNMTLKSADGGEVRVLVNDPSVDHQQGDVLEIIGTLSPENYLECFVTRSMGREFDLDLYNGLITKVMGPENGQYSTYFSAK